MKNQKYVRIYYYDVPDKGWGDRGTFTYVLLDSDCFKEVIETSFNGHEYVRTLLTDKGQDAIRNIEGYDLYNMGWEITTKEEYKTELQGLRDKLARMILED